MVKKSNDFDSDEEENEPTPNGGFKIGLSTIIIALFYIILIQLFQYLLSIKTDDAVYGSPEIILGLIFSVIIIAFLLWIKYLVSVNRHMALLIGLAGIGVMIYGFYLKYHGPFTNTFMIIGGLVGVIYIGWEYVRSEKENDE